MPETAQAQDQGRELPFRWVCGRCGSRSLYTDYDLMTGERCIACMICANRWFPAVALVGGTRDVVPVEGINGKKADRANGAAPRRQHYTPAAEAAPLDQAARRTERMENVNQGIGPKLIVVGRTAPKRREDTMAKPNRGKCSNCGREQALVHAGRLCWTCGKAVKTLTGEERTIALADIKRRIEAGEIKPGHRTGIAPKTAVSASADDAPAPQAQSPSPEAAVAEAAGVVAQRELKRIRGQRVADVVISPDAPQEIPIKVRLILEIAVRIV